MGSSLFSILLLRAVLCITGNKGVKREREYADNKEVKWEIAEAGEYGIYSGEYGIYSIDSQSVIASPRCELASFI